MTLDWTHIGLWLALQRIFGFVTWAKFPTCDQHDILSMYTIKELARESTIVSDLHSSMRICFGYNFVR
jgi:hypothetical protein